MRLLLDTHVWLWMLAQPGRLGKLEPLVQDPHNDLLFSAASAWEIGVKYAIGRLHIPEAPAEFVARRLSKTGVTRVPIKHEEALLAAELPPHHRDPFDRVLVAQALLHEVPLLSADPKITAYSVEVIGPD